MFLGGLWNNNETSSIILISLIGIWMFFAIGKIIQKKLNLFKSNTYLAIPIGFFIYWLATSIIYQIFLIFNFQFAYIKWIDVVKDIFIISLIVCFYNEWFPSKIFFNPKNLIINGLNLIMLVGFIFMFLGFSSIFEWFNSIDEDNSHFMELSNGIHNSSSTFRFEPFAENENILNALASNQIFYYFSGNIAFTNDIDLINVYKYIWPIFIIAIIYFSIFSSFQKIKNNCINFVFIIGATFTALLIFGISTNTASGLFLLSVTLFFVVNLVYIDSINFTSKTSNIIMILLSILMMSTMQESSFILIPSFLISIIYYVIKKNGSIIQITMISLIGYGIILSIFMLSLIWWSVFLTIIGTFLLFAPIWKLYFKTKSSQIFDHEYKITKNLSLIILIFFSGILMTYAISLFFFFESFADKFHEMFTNLFINIKGGSLNQVLSGVIYPLLLAWWIILIIFHLTGKYKMNEFVNTMGILSVFFLNPISISVWEMIFTTELSNLIIFLPALSILSLGSYDLLSKIYKINRV